MAGWKGNKYIRRTGSKKSRKSSRSRSYGKRSGKKYNKKFVKNLKKPTVVKGIRRKLNTKTELKQATSTIADLVVRCRGTAPGAIPSCTSQIIFATTGLDSAGAPFFVVPAQGVGPNQRIGLKLNLQFLTIMFTAEMNSVNDENSGVLVDDIPPFVKYRLMVVKRRSRGTNATLSLPAGNFATNTPLDARLFDIQYDKTFTLATGAPVEWRGVSSIQEAGPTHPTHPRNFKFKIPLRQTVEVDPNTNDWAFDADLYVAVVPDQLYYTGGVFPTYSPDKVLIMRNIFYRVYWTDD